MSLGTGFKEAYMETNIAANEFISEVLPQLQSASREELHEIFTRSQAFEIPTMHMHVVRAICLGKMEKYQEAYEELTEELRSYPSNAIALELKEQFEEDPLIASLLAPRQEPEPLSVINTGPMAPQEGNRAPIPQITPGTDPELTIKEYYATLQALPTDRSDYQVQIFLDLITRGEPFAFTRFDSGAMSGITKVGKVVAHGDQVVDLSLHTRLIEAISHTQKNYFIGVPCADCAPEFFNLARQYVQQPMRYALSATALSNRNWPKAITGLSDSCKGRRCAWISGDDQQLSQVQDVLGISIASHLTFPRKNSWGSYEEITRQYETLPDEIDMVFVSLGPTASIFIQEMFERNPQRTFIDIGSTFDPFTRNVWHDAHLEWQHGRNRLAPCRTCN